MNPIAPPAYSVPTPSVEQQLVVDTVKNGSNVVVDAVAGSGKTTTVLSIASAIPDKRIIQITFNAQLKFEVRTKATRLGLNNIKVHTYHSLATTYYDRSAHTDARIIALLASDLQLIVGIAEKVDVLIIDEAQDMTLLYFKLLNKFINDIMHGKRVQLVILGDRFQGVYEFMKADTRFLTLAPDIWKGCGKKDDPKGSKNNNDFVHLTLRESYRVTKQIAWFVNNCMVGEERIVARKEGCKVEWYIGDVFAPKKMFLNDIIKQIKNGKILPEDIFVLGTSLKGSKTPMKVMENAFVDNNIPVYVPISEECKLDDDVTRGKIVFATFPSSKGRERPIVILMGFDENYFNFFAKEAPRDVCPPPIYVAATRATKRLIVVGSALSCAPPFVKWTQLDFKSNVSVVNDEPMIRKSMVMTKTDEMSKRQTSPTELVKFLKQETIEYLTPIVDELFAVVQDADYDVKIPSKVKTKGGSQEMYEDVSDLNGLAIPTIWEQANSSCGTTEDQQERTTIHKRIASSANYFFSKSTFFQKMIKKMVIPCKNISDFLFMCNIYSALTDGYHGRLSQIKKYDWLDQSSVNQCLGALDKHVSKKDVEFEYCVDALVQSPYGMINVSGNIDVIEASTVWEIKCVDVLQLEHMLQLMIYYWMFNMTCKHDAHKLGPRDFKLINVRTGEVRQLMSSSLKQKHDIEKVIWCLLTHKYKPMSRLTDEAFVCETVEATASKASTSSKASTASTASTASPTSSSDSE